MAKPTDTSRAGRHYRPKDPDRPIARYCQAAVQRMGGNQARVAEELDVSRALVVQWTSGLTDPSARNLVALSIKSGLSLGYLSTLASAYAHADAPKLGDVESRLALLPAMLRDAVLRALAENERIAAQVPREAWRTPVDDSRLEDWRAPRGHKRKPQS